MQVSRLSELGVAGAILLTALTGAQFYLGSHETEFGSGTFASADEPAHVVSGLMVREYLRAAAPSPPLPFARQYYDAYPKVAMGHWPPLFYALVGLFLWVFPLSKWCLFALLASIALAPGLWLYAALREQRWSISPAFSAASLLTGLPLIQAGSSQVTSELLAVALVLGAVLQFARFLESRRDRDAVLFGCWVGAAVLTKGNAFALALLPIFVALLTADWRLLLQRGVWLAAVVALVIAAPWYIYAFPFVRGEVRPYPPESWLWHWQKIGWRNAWDLARLCGPVLTLLAGIALWRNWRRAPGRDVALAAALLSLWFFYSYASPHQQLRFAVYSAPALVWFGAQTAERLAGKGWKAALVLLVALIAANLASPAAKRTPHGFITAAAWIARQSDERAALASGGSFGEGALISEIAWREPAPRRRLLRSSKLLAESTWMGDEYRMLVGDTAGVSSLLARGRVGYIVLDSGARSPLPHDVLLRDAVQNDTGWRCVLRDRDVEIYRREPPSNSHP